MAPPAALSHNTLASDAAAARAFPWANYLQPARAPLQLQEQEIIFATYYATSKNSSYRPDIESLQPDLKFAAMLRATHPRCRIAFMTDLETKLDVGGDIEIFRTFIDRSKIGRNAYANYYQFKAQVDFLEKLVQEGVDADVVFLDSDILVLASLADAFEGREFDYGFTISDAVDMPVNMGMMFVKRGHMRQASDFLKELMAHYPFHETFTAGQIAIGEYVGIQNVAREVHWIRNRALERQFYIKRVHNRFDVQFLPCLKYNFCNCGQSCCTDPARSHWHPKTPDDFRRVGLKVVHFVGHRKPCMTLVHDAFVAGGIDAAYVAVAEMPNSEEGCEEVKRQLDVLKAAGKKLDLTGFASPFGALAALTNSRSVVEAHVPHPPVSATPPSTPKLADVSSAIAGVLDSVLASELSMVKAGIAAVPGVAKSATAQAV